MALVLLWALGCVTAALLLPAHEPHHYVLTVTRVLGLLIATAVVPRVLRKRHPIQRLGDVLILVGAWLAIRASPALLIPPPPFVRRDIPAFASMDSLHAWLDTHDPLSTPQVLAPPTEPLVHVTGTLIAYSVPVLLGVTVLVLFARLRPTASDPSQRDSRAITDTQADPEHDRWEQTVARGAVACLAVLGLAAASPTAAQDADQLRVTDFSVFATPTGSPALSVDTLTARMRFALVEVGYALAPRDEAATVLVSGQYAQFGRSGRLNVRVIRTADQTVLGDTTVELTGDSTIVDSIVAIAIAEVGRVLGPPRGALELQQAGATQGEVTPADHAGVIWAADPARIARDLTPNPGVPPGLPGHHRRSPGANCHPDSVQ